MRMRIRYRGSRQRSSRRLIRASERQDSGRQRQRVPHEAQKRQEKKQAPQVAQNSAERASEQARRRRRQRGKGSVITRNRFPKQRLSRAISWRNSVASELSRALVKVSSHRVLARTASFFAASAGEAWAVGPTP